MASLLNTPTIPPADANPLTLKWTPEHLSTPWGEYTVQVRFKTQAGRLGLPLGQPIGATGPTAVVVDLHKRFCLKIVDFVATRVNASPVLPSETSPDSNLVFLFGDFLPHPPELQPDGITYKYGGTGQYIYQCLTPVTEQTGFPLTFPPYESPASQTSFTSSDFDQSIVK